MHINGFLQHFDHLPYFPHVCLIMKLELSPHNRTEKVNSMNQWSIVQTDLCHRTNDTKRLVLISLYMTHCEVQKFARKHFRTTVVLVFQSSLSCFSLKPQTL